MTGQVTADDSLRDQLAALLHEESYCSSTEQYPTCDGPEDHRAEADAVLSWLLSQGTTEFGKETKGLGFVTWSNGSSYPPEVQRRVVSVSSVWTTVEGTP